MESLVAGERFRSRDRPAIHDELVTAHEALDVRPLRWPRCCWLYRASRKIDCTERFLNVQHPWFSVRCDAPPVVQPKGGVAGLLNFGHQQTGAQRVNGTSRKQDTLAGAGLERMQPML